MIQPVSAVANGRPSRRRIFAYWGFRCLLLAAGLGWIVNCALGALGGWERLWLFTRTDQHRFTAMAMLTGTLRLRSSLALLGFDEQVYNGAIYTNWGFGVPLLQLPFHAFASHWLPTKFFPDRAIYFVYLTATIPFLWAAFSRLLQMRGVGSTFFRRDLLSWAATGLVLASTLYPLMACRFIVYEETICYMGLCELVALGCYLWALRSWGVPAVCGMGAASGFGLLVRPTGLIHLGVWGALTMLESRRRRAKIAFGLAIAPFFAFWLYTNWVKTGSPIGLGFSNEMVNNVAGTGMVRFGSTCIDARSHIPVLAMWLLRALFILVGEDRAGWMQACHFQFEERPPAAHEPFLGLTVMAILVWILLHYVARRERRIAVYVPLSAMVFLFAEYVYAGVGFAWRYVGDFWPLIVLACVQYVGTLPSAANKLLGAPLAIVLTVCSFGGYRQSLDRWQPSGYYGEHWETLSPADAKTMWEGFTKSRWRLDNVLPSIVHCGDRRDWPPGNGQGWGADCHVDIVSNFYLGVPKKRDGKDYEVRVQTQDMTAASLRLYLNGRIYTAIREGKTYKTSVRIPYERLHSAIVMTTVEWAREQPPPGKLISIELV